MWEIFQKKRYLVDYLKGFVDIHNHILPGIDDGAKTVKDSISLIKGMGELGISRFIATPHIMHNYYPNSPETINSALTELKSELMEQHITDVVVKAAAEHMIDDNFENLLEEGGIMPLGKDLILIEMSFLQPSINLDIAIDKTLEKGYFPVLAHPERYLYYSNNLDIFTKLKERGTLLQVNLLSLGEYYGTETNKIAHRLLEDKLVDFVASDLHHTRHLRELSKVRISEKVLNNLFPVLENTIERFY